MECAGAISGMSGGSAMKLPRRQFLRLSLGAAALPTVSEVAGAQAYPLRPVRVIIGFPPGSAPDTVTRIISQWLTERLSQPVVVESKPGAASNISIQAAIASPPDGYALVYVS